MRTESAIVALSRRYPRYGYRRIHAVVDECLNRELISSVLEAQVIARAFQDEYSTERPHSSIGYQVPAEYRALLLGQAPGSGQARQAGPSIRPKLACTSQSANNPETNPQPAQTPT